MQWQLASRPVSLLDCHLSRDLVQWQNLQTLDLAANPLHCDCKLAWLRDVLIASGDLSKDFPLAITLALAGNTSKAECATPSSLNGKAVQDLPLGHLRWEKLRQRSKKRCLTDL